MDIYQLIYNIYNSFEKLIKFDLLVDSRVFISLELFKDNFQRFLEADEIIDSRRTISIFFFSFHVHSISLSL